MVSRRSLGGSSPLLVNLKMENLKVKPVLGVTKPISLIKPTEFDVRRSLELEKVRDLLFHILFVFSCFSL